MPDEVANTWSVSYEMIVSAHHVGFPVESLGVFQAGVESGGTVP